MIQLSFSGNQNKKLYNDCFTTIRTYYPSNEQKFAVGNRLEVMLNGEKLGIAEVLDVKTLFLSQLNDWVLAIDTGLVGEEAKNIFRKMNKITDKTSDLKLSFVLLRYIDRANRHQLAKKTLFDMLNHNLLPDVDTRFAQFNFRVSCVYVEETVQMDYKFCSDTDLYPRESRNVGEVLFIPDITIFHKGFPIYFIFITINKSYLEYNNIRAIRQYAEKVGLSPEIWEIRADDIFSVSHLPLNEIKEIKGKLIEF